jgi:hypothetical protein
VKLYAKGQRVSQATYGAGTVTSSDEKYTVIEFDEQGRRVFLTDMMKLGQTDVPAPAKAGKEKRTRKPSAKAAAAKAAKAEGKAESAKTAAASKGQTSASKS